MQPTTKITELEFAKRDMDVLYAASQALVGASTPAEILEAFSAYARSNGASSGHLFYFRDQQPGYIEVVAEWSLIEAQWLQVGWHLDVSQRTLGQYWLERPTQPTLIADVLTSEVVGADSRDTLSLYQVRGLAALPLNNKGRWIGVLYFYWDTPHPFDLRDERILSTLQRMASPVIESIQLLEQSRKRTLELERANQELNLLYHASEVINAANSYAEVVEAVAQFDPEADVVTLMLWEGFDWETASYLEVLVVLDRNGSGKIIPGVRLRKEDFPIARHMLGERVWLFEDAENDPRVDPVTAQSWQMLDIRSFMGPAFYVNNRWMGGITFHTAHSRTYSEREVRLFTGIGDLAQAAIVRIRLQQETEASRHHAEILARANIELLEQTQRRANELESANAEIDLLYRVGEAINAANTFDELVQAVSAIISGEIAVALYFWEGWNFGTAAYVEQVAATGHMAANNGQRTPKAMLAYTEFTPHDRITIFEDVTNDPRIEMSLLTEYRERSILASLSIRLFVEERWIGALVFHSKTPRVFSTRERRMASGVGGYVLGAVERIRLREETEAARQAAESMAEQAQKLAALEERTRLARELHDSVSQVLYGIGLGARTARALLIQNPARLNEPLDYILALAEAGLTEMRALIFELRPESLEEEGLITALSKQVASLQSRHGIRVETDFCDEPPLTVEVKSDLYRIAREALYNALKHAQATHISLTLRQTNVGYHLEIVDNGLGFDTNQSFPGHLGLKSMRERMNSLNGSIQIESEPGEGTRIRVLLLINESSESR